MKHLFILLGFSAFINVASAQNMTELRKQQFNVSRDGLAIKGYDPVAYFTAGKAVKGKTGSPTGFRLPKTVTCLRESQQNMNPNTEDGARMLWVQAAKK
jgi:hypothetical protein